MSSYVHMLKMDTWRFILEIIIWTLHTPLPMITDNLKQNSYLESKWKYNRFQYFIYLIIGWLWLLQTELDSKSIYICSHEDRKIFNMKKKDKLFRKIPNTTYFFNRLYPFIMFLRIIPSIKFTLINLYLFFFNCR